MKKFLFFSLSLLLLTRCGGGENSGTTSDENKTTPETTQAPPPETNSAPAKNIIFNGKVNGEDWQGGPMGMSEVFWSKGVEMLKKDFPFLQLVFVSAVEGDTRQILIYLDHFAEKTGPVDVKAVSVTVSGTDNDDKKTNYLASYPTQGKPGNVNMEITKWEKVSETMAKVSGTLSGSIPGTLGSPGVEIENGVFTDIAIEIK